MKHLIGVSHIAIAACLGAPFAIVLPASAADFTVPAGPADTVQKTLSGTDTLTVASGGALSSASNPAVSLNAASTGVVITNSGTISNTSSGRAIRMTGTANGRTVTLNNNAGGVIESADDAFQLNISPTGGTITVNNAGIIRSTGSGQALDFDASTGGAAIIINNKAGGEIYGAGNDGIRPGQGAVVTNAGLIHSDGIPDAKNDGIDWQGRDGKVINQAGGVISGQRHGITSDENVDVVNEAGARIEGRNGSGVGSDGNGTVVNMGTITGSWDGKSVNGDGDGVDIDFIGTVKNSGTIKGISAAGVDSGGQPNGAEGIAMGGGLIENGKGALISGGTRGILVDDGSAGSAYGATTIVNAGRIEGLAGPAITMIGDFADSITNSGEIIGTGGVALQMGAGNDTLTLLPGSVITGTADGGAGTDTVTLSASGAEGETDGVFAGAVNFELLNVAAGNWSLTEAATFSGGTTIGGTGRLNVNNVLTSAVTVNSGGILAGTGSLTSVTVNDGGTIAPGNSIGTLTITGDLLQKGGSTYAAEIAANGTGDKLTVGGKATLENGAVLNVSRAAGTYTPGTRFTLLTAADGVSGKYTLVQTVANGRELRLGQNGTGVYVDVARTGASLADTAQTHNQDAVAAPFGTFGAANAAYAALTLIPDDDAARAALDMLSGEIHASAHTAMVQDAKAVDGAVRARTASPATGQGGVWGQFLIGTADDDGMGGAADADRDTVGGVIGGDITLGDAWRIGIAGAYTSDTVKIAERGSRAKVETGHVVGYAGGAMGDVRIRLGGGYSWSNVDTRRAIAFPGFTDLTTARYNGDTLHGFAEIGYSLGLFEPFAGIAAYKVKADPFTEAGGLASLSGERGKQTFAHSLLGVRFDTGLGESLSARGSLAWQHGFDDLASMVNVGFNAGAADFDVFGTALSRNAAALSLALVWTASANVEVSLGYDGEIGNNGSSHMGRATVSVGF